MVHELGVRVRIKIIINQKTLEAVALANSGFETDYPQLLVPKNFILLNNVDLERIGSPKQIEYDTAGGSIVMYVYPRICRIKLVDKDLESKEVLSDLVISPIEREIVMSDALIEELGIILLSPRKGLWRHFSDPVDKTRISYPPQYW